MKNITALLAAFVMTAVVGMCVLVLGANALFNKNTVAASTGTFNNPGQAQGVALSGDSPSASAAGDNQALISQYQSQLNDAQQQLADASNQIQQYQQVLRALARQGLISISPDGTIYIQRQFGDDAPSSNP